MDGLSISLARYRFHFTATTPVQFPEWAGSTLRGGFGHALRHTACMTRQKDCNGCPLQATCPYPALFAPPPRALPLQKLTQAPAPYVIEPEGWGIRRIEPGQNWHLDMVLMGRALHELPLITLAWQRAAARGLGAGDGSSALTHVEVQHQDGHLHPVLETPQARFADHPIPPLDLRLNSKGPVHLCITTPLRLQENGKALPPTRLDAGRLLMQVVRRVSLIATCHGSGPPHWDYGKLKAQAQAVRDERQLRWLDWTRRSARQQQTMQLGGVVGDWTLHDLPPEFLPLLKLGEWLHIGKETVFGLGRYHIRQDNSPTLAQGPEHPRQAIEKEGKSKRPRIQPSPDF